MSYILEPASVPDASDILWKSVDEGWICFEPSSGTTLLLAPAARFVLDLLAAAGVPLDETEMAAALHREEPEASLQDCRDTVTEILAALLSVQLIRAQPLDRR